MGTWVLDSARDRSREACRLLEDYYKWNRSPSRRKCARRVIRVLVCSKDPGMGVIMTVRCITVFLNVMRRKSSEAVMTSRTSCQLIAWKFRTAYLLCNKLHAL